MIVRELSWREPLEAFAPLAGEAWAHLLHGGDLSLAPEWSILVAFPATRLTAFKGEVALNGSALDESFFAALDSLHRGRFFDTPASHAPFCNGLIGFAGYELAGEIESGLALPPSPLALPDGAFGAYDAAALFNRQAREAYITGCDEQACNRLEQALGSDPLCTPALPEFSQMASNFDRPAYEEMVAGIIDAILDGDIFQANVAQQFFASCSVDISGFDLFRKIAAASDAHHGALLQFEEGAIVSNSPERFFKIDNVKSVKRHIVVEPIKGTRRRSTNESEDIALAESLLSDPKDRAENIMIADLMRNDLSKICRDHSIREDDICELMSLTRVHHLVSRISGALCEEVGPADIFRALFPSGSITGAPKIEAMVKIAQAEKAGRGPYCGAIGYISDDGAMDFSVAIRTLMLTKDDSKLCATFPAGGGVTLGSTPALEYEETLVKAEAIRRVLNPAKV